MPPLFPIEPPFLKMDKAKIRVTSNGKDAVAEIHAFNRSQGFGIRLDLPPTLSMGPTPPHKWNEWQVIGTANVVCRPLNLEEIQAITQQDDEEIPFALNLKR